MKLDGRTAIVTGASSGIGRGIATAFAEEGANVVIASIEEESRVEDDELTTTELIEEQGGEAVFHQMDVSVKEDVEAMVKATVEEYGGVDILVNNAGVTSANPVHKVTEEEWDRVHDVNLKGVFLCSKYAIPHILESDHGRVINIASQRGLRGGSPTEKAAYVSSKGAASNLTRQMALDYGPQGVPVNAICPGPVYSGMTQVESEEGRERLLEGVLTSFVGEPKRDIAPMAVLLASDAGRFIHGTNIPVDGGYLVKPAGN